MQTSYSPNRNIFVINHPDQLLQILEDTTSKSVVLQIPSLTENEILYWEDKLTTEKNACGCEEGTVFLLITLVGLAILIFNGSSLLPKGSITTTFLGIALSFMSIGIGKSFGIHRAKHRLARSIHELNAALNGRQLYPLQNTPEGEVS